MFSVHHDNPSVLAAELIVPADTFMLAFVEKGSTIALPPGSSHPLIVPPSTVWFAGPGESLLRLTKGEHQASVILWNRAVTPLMGEVLDGADNHNAKVRSSKLGLKSAFSKIASLPTLRPVVHNISLLSIIHEVLAVIVEHGSALSLVTVPDHLPEPLAQVAEMVRADPTKHWPAPEAANIAGYSTFHFSRVFKQHVGVGFQEFVDRCRTELSLDLLRSTNTPVELVATKCGFGSPQTLRDSLRDYLGVVPSDIRWFNDRSKHAHLL